MIFDLDTHEDNQTFEADICIIGGGAAGISMAMEFLSSNLTVVLLESGGMEYEQKVQDSPSAKP